MLTTEFHGRCENLAIHYRHELGLHGYEPLSARRLAHLLAVDIYQPCDFLHGDMLQTALGSTDWNALMVINTTEAMNTIIYNPSLSEIACEESIMHELAHYILGHAPEKLGAISARFATRSYSKIKETEADLLTDYLKFPELAKAYTTQLHLDSVDIMARYSISNALLRRQLSR